MKKPVIGLLPSVTPDQGALSLPYPYAIVIEKAGGLPIILPHTASSETAKELVSRCDGFIFTGGPDMNPSFFGEKPWMFLGTVSPFRDSTDALYFKEAYALGKPIVGICRGIQVVNILLGGTVWQDLGSQIPESEKLFKHRQEAPRYARTHGVTVEKDSVLEKAWGSTHFMVNTFHHQAVKDPAPGMVITAVSDDGVIEGLSMPGYGFLELVQWHPEEMACQDAGAQRFFDIFVEACR